MNRVALLARATLFACAASTFVPLPAAAVIPQFSSTLGVEAFAVNSAIQPGISRNSTGSGPISDAVSELYGLNTATGAASVDTSGLHSSAAVHGDSTNAYYSASAGGSAGLVNRFRLVSPAGFTGTQALVRITYSFGGTFNMFPSLQDCPTCFGSVDANLSVDGMTESFNFNGASSLGTMNNANFVLGGVTRGGVLQGMLSVDTELYLRAGLVTGVHCQSNPVDSCGAEALFGGTLSYSGASSEGINIVWGLTPTLVPEPSSWLMIGAGLLGLATWRFFGKRSDDSACGISARATGYR